MPQQIRLIRADNPSPLTGTGTNTWLLGQGEVTLIDPGPDLDSHLAAILALTRDERITRILVTHAHLDHSALTRRLVAATGAEVLAFGPANSGRSATMTALAAEGLTSTEGADTSFAPDRTLRDGERLPLGDTTIEALHLPGHMGCHLGFAVGETLFSGDHVMAWSTSLVSPPDGDMADYMASLRRLAARRWSRMLPGHGPAIEDPSARLTYLIDHRLDPRSGHPRRPAPPRPRDRQRHRRPGLYRHPRRAAARRRAQRAGPPHRPDRPPPCRIQRRHPRRHPFPRALRLAFISPPPPLPSPWALL